MSCIEKIKHESETCTSDGKSLQVFYDDAKNKYTGYCFSCAAHGLNGYVENPYGDSKPPAPTIKTKEQIKEEIDEVRALKVPTFTHRDIPAEYLKRSGVRLALSEYDGKTPSSLNFPYSLGGDLIGFKTIMLDKKFMWSVGNIKGADLFNWEVAKKKSSQGVRKLYVTEGEFDCLALEFMLESYAKNKNSKYDKFAVVSLPHGVGSAVSTLGRMRKEISQLFESVVLVFDNDDPGHLAVKEVQKVLPDVLAAPYPTNSKDANECLSKGEGMLFADFVLWKSRKPAVEGVVDVSTVLTRALEPPQMGLSYPWDGLTELVYGQRFGEASAWGAGVGLGKTLTAHEIAAHNIKVHGENVFMVLLEEQVQESLWNVSGKIDSIPYHKPEYAREHWEQFISTAQSLDGKLFLWESDSNTENRFNIEEIVKAIRFNTLEYGCRFHVIDNMTRLVDHLSASEANDFINKWASEIANLATELNIHIDVYSHLNPSKDKDGRDHESGGEVRAGQFTGSRGIMRAFPVMFGFERNKHAEDTASNSYISCIKNRKYGGEGKIKTQYQTKTGRLLQYNWDGDGL